MFRAAPYFPLPRSSESFRRRRQLQRRPHAQGLSRFAGETELSRLRNHSGGRRLDRHHAADCRRSSRRCATCAINQNLGLSVARNTGIAAADGRDRGVYRRGLPRGRRLALLSRRRFARRRVRRHGRPQLAAAGRFRRGRCGDGVARRPGARHARRPSGRAHSRLQHGVLQMGAGRGRRVRPDFPQSRRRRGPLLARAAGGPQNRFQPVGVCLALPALDRRRVFETAARLRRGRGVAGAQASGILQLARRQRLARAHLHRVEFRRAGAVAGDLPRTVRQRDVPTTLRLASRH